MDFSFCSLRITRVTFTFEEDYQYLHNYEFYLTPSICHKSAQSQVVTWQYPCTTEYVIHCNKIRTLSDSCSLTFISIIATISSTPILPNVISHCLHCFFVFKYQISWYECSLILFSKFLRCKIALDITVTAALNLKNFKVLVSAGLISVILRIILLHTAMHS
jgi:hypothetical protein